MNGAITAANGAFVLVPSDDQVGGTYARLQAITTAVVVLLAFTLVLRTHGRLGQATRGRRHEISGPEGVPR